MVTGRLGIKFATVITFILFSNLAFSGSWRAAPLKSVSHSYVHPGKLGTIVVNAAYGQEGIKDVRVEVGGKSIEVPRAAYSDLEYAHIDDIQILYADPSEKVFYLTIYYGDWDVCDSPAGCTFSRIKYVNGEFVSREVSVSKGKNIIEYKRENLRQP
jgi:hypothetical protein